MVMKGDGLGVVGDIILGIAGVLSASALLGIPNPMNGIDATSIIVAFIGGIIVVTIPRAVRLGSRLRNASPLGMNEQAQRPANGGRANHGRTPFDVELYLMIENAVADRLSSKVGTRFPRLRLFADTASDRDAGRSSRSGDNVS